MSWAFVEACHLWHPCLVFFVQVIVFYKIDYVFFMETINLEENLLPSMAYWQHLDMACPQHDPTKGVVSLNAWHETIEVKAMVMVETLPPSSLTYAITQVMNPCFASTSLTYKAIALLMVFAISKNPTIMWHGSNWAFKKCTIMTKVSILTLNNHRNDARVTRFKGWKHILVLG